MTLKELSQIPHLKEEVELYRERIRALEQREDHLSGEELLHLQSQLEKRDNELQRLKSYIENVPDSGIRNILTLRCIRGLSWVQISFRVSGYSADNARKTVKRFLEKK